MKPDRNLQAFIAAAKRQKLTHAADNLYIAQSTLTKRLSVLEAELGVPLFTRMHRGVELNNYGTILYPRAKAIEGELQRTGEEIEILRSGADNPINIGAGALWNLRYLPNLIAEFRSRHPRIEFKITTGTEDTLLPMLERGALEIALSGDSLTANPNVLNRPPIFDVDIHVAANITNQIHSTAVIGLDDVEHYPWCVYQSSDKRDKGKVFEFDDLRGFLLIS